MCFTSQGNHRWGEMLDENFGNPVKERQIGSKHIYTMLGKISDHPIIIARLGG
jgi:hypothetical protein